MPTSSMAQYGTSEPLRILLVSSQPQCHQEVEAILANHLDGYHLSWVAQPSLALNRAQDLIPHVILVDDELDGARLPQVISQLVRWLPESAVLAFIPDGDITQASQVVLAGARGFITKPLGASNFVETLQQVLSARFSQPTEREHPTIKGQVVVFCAPKGGTGRTTLAINTAVSLLRHTKQAVALVDADYAAPALDVALNLHGEANIADLLPRLSRLDRELINSTLATHVSGLKVLLAPPPANLTAPISLPHVQQVLAKLKEMFPWVIVDLGLPMDDTAFAFLDGADRIVMSVLPEMVGLRNTRLMLDQLLDRGYPSDRIWLVLNRATMKSGVSVQDIERRLRVQIRFTIPDDQPLITFSVNRGIPAVIGHPRSAVARAFQHFAQILEQEMSPHKDATPRRQWDLLSPIHALKNLFARLRLAGI